MHRGVVEADLTHLTGARGAASRFAHAAERAEEHVRHRAVHRFAHQDRQDETGKSVERAGNDEHVVAERETGRRGGESGVGIEQRHDDRHVRGTDGNNEQNAEDQRERRH